MGTGRGSCNPILEFTVEIGDGRGIGGADGERGDRSPVNRFKIRERPSRSAVEIAPSCRLVDRAEISSSRCIKIILWTQW
jgi:hypothetical protein